MKTTTFRSPTKNLVNAYEHETVAKLPAKLRMEVLILAESRPDFATTKKYASFRRDYSDWLPVELVQRIRLLLSDTHEVEIEILAAFDELESRD